MNLSSHLLQVLILVAQAAPDAVKDDGAAARLAYMKASVADFEIRASDGASTVYRLLPEPVLRWSNTIGGSRDGTIFLWVDDTGRPGVAAQAYSNRHGIWVHEFASLATGPLTATTAGGPIWSPARAGVEPKPIPGAPRPAATPEQRMRQMRELVQDFAAEDKFQGKSWQPLRPLSKPFARYGKPGSEVIDGALFSFVLTTDPEAYLMLEARQGAEKEGPVWHYAFAPSTVFPLRATWKGKAVWEHNIDGPRWGLSDTLHQKEIAPADPALIPKAP